MFSHPGDQPSPRPPEPAQRGPTDTLSTAALMVAALKQMAESCPLDLSGNNTRELRLVAAAIDREIARRSRVRPD